MWESGYLVPGKQDRISTVEFILGHYARFHFTIANPEELIGTGLLLDLR